MFSPIAAKLPCRKMYSCYNPPSKCSLVFVSIISISEESKIWARLRQMPYPWWRRRFTLSSRDGRSSGKSGSHRHTFNEALDSKPTGHGHCEACHCESQKSLEFKANIKNLRHDFNITYVLSGNSHVTLWMTRVKEWSSRSILSSFFQKDPK